MQLQQQELNTSFLSSQRHALKAPIFLPYTLLGTIESVQAPVLLGRPKVDTTCVKHRQGPTKQREKTGEEKPVRISHNPVELQDVKITNAVDRKTLGLVKLTCNPVELEVHGGPIDVKETHKDDGVVVAHLLDLLLLLSLVMTALFSGFAFAVCEAEPDAILQSWDPVQELELPFGDGLVVAGITAVLGVLAFLVDLLGSLGRKQLQNPEAFQQDRKVSDYPWLSEDPWEGCEELAKEDFQSWMEDFSRMSRDCVSKTSGVSVRLPLPRRTHADGRCAGAVWSWDHDDPWEE